MGYRANNTRSLFIRIWLVVLSLAILPLSFEAKPAGAQVGVFDAARAQRVTVQVMQVFTNPRGETVLSCLGSGTIVSPDGLVLTNAHVVLPLTGCRADKLAIAITKNLGEAPVASYYAQLLVYNVGWDLAVLQITETIDGRPIDKAALNLPFADLGDSEVVNLDSTIEVVGYAPLDKDTSSSAVSRSIRATVSGFTAEARVGDRAWIKTRTAVPGSMTGGGAYNLEGQLIGIPTIEPVSRGLPGGEAPDCVRVQDSNGDGRVDDSDLCIPVSGFINAMRPSRLARALILAARIGVSVSYRPATDAPPASSGPARFSRLFFSSGVDLAGMPTSVIDRAPNGITRLYLYFDYENMQDGMIYEMRVSRNGFLDPTFSLAPATWSGGQSGLWYVGNTAQAWPDGDYEFVLFIEGVRSASAKITIGGPALTQPEFSSVLFGVLDESSKLVNAGNILPVSNQINAEFVYNNMKDGSTWRQVWYYEGLKIAEDERAWAGGSNGKGSASAAAAAGGSLQPGRYRLELYVDGKLAATSDFVMAGGQVAYNTELFTNLTFASELQNGVPRGVIGATFPNTITSLYALFDWRDIAPGTPVTWRWTVDDALLFEETLPWSYTANGTGAWARLNTSGQVTDGTYRLELRVAGVAKGNASARVGLGQLPVALFTTESGVRVQGRIIDAETRRGIFGATFIVLKPTFFVRDFTYQMSEVFDLATTDATGRFALTKPLPRGEAYSVIAVARGYLPVGGDGLDINETTRGPVEYNIELNRD